MCSSDLWAPILGVLGGNDELVHQGAIAAVYRFVLQWAAERGADGVDIGRTRPSLMDSIAWYKAKWGFRPERDALAHLVAVRLGPHCAAIRERFASRRILVQEGDGVSLLDVLASAKEAGPREPDVASAVRDE